MTRFTRQNDKQATSLQFFFHSVLVENVLNVKQPELTLTESYVLVENVLNAITTQTRSYKNHIDH